MGKFKLLFCLSWLTTLGLQAQTRQIQGTVVSAEDGQPLIGVTVLIEGTSTGTSTALDGSYTLSLANSTQGGGKTVNIQLHRI